MNKRLDNRGHEVLDPKPLAIPARIRKVSETDRFRSIVSGMLSDHVANQGFETFEESNDFFIDDDFFPMSPHELTPELEEQFNEFVSRSIAAAKGDSPPPDPEVFGGLRVRRPEAPSEPPVVPGTEPVLDSKTASKVAPDAT